MRDGGEEGREGGRDKCKEGGEGGGKDGRIEMECGRVGREVREGGRKWRREGGNNCCLGRCGQVFSITGVQRSEGTIVSFRNSSMFILTRNPSALVEWLCSHV